MPQAVSGTSRPSRQQLKLINCASDQPPVAECDGLADEFSRDLQTLFRAAGASIALEGSRRRVGGHGERHGFTLRHGDAPVSTAPITLYPVQGLRGILKGHHPDLSLLVAGISQATSAVGDTLARVSCKLLTSAPRAAAVGCYGMLSSLRETFPETRSLEADAAVDGLLAGDVLDLLVLEAESASVLARFAVGIAGTRALDVRISLDSDGLRWEHRTSRADSVDPVAVVLSGARLLQVAGQQNAAMRLHDAVLRTLEDGVHTSALPVLLPYSTRVTPARMIEAIGERVGQKPRRLAAARFPAQQDKVPQLRRVL